MTVQQVVEQGVQETLDLLRSSSGSTRSSPSRWDDAMNKLLEKQGNVQEKLDAVNAWDLDSQLDMAMDALRARRPMRSSRFSPAASSGAWRCAGCCCKSRMCCFSMSRPIISMPNRVAGWSSTCGGMRARSSPSPTTAIFWTTSPAGSWNSTAARAFPGRAIIHRWLEQKQARLAVEEKTESARQKALEHELEWVRQSPKARQAKSKARLAAYEAMLAQDRARSEKRNRNLHPARPAARRAWSSKPRASARPTAINLLMSRMSFPLPPGGIVGIIGPNGAGKTTLFRMITGQEKPDAGKFTPRRQRQTRLRGTEPRRPRGRRQRLAGHLRRPGTSQARQRAGQQPRLRVALRFRRHRPAEESRHASPAANATAFTSPACSRAAPTCSCSTSPPTTWTSTPSVRAGRSHGKLRRLRRGHQPRPLVPRPRSRRTSWPSKATAQVVWFDGNYTDIRSRPQSPAGHRGGSAASDQVPQAHQIATPPWALQDRQPCLGWLRVAGYLEILATNKSGGGTNQRAEPAKSRLGLYERDGVA